MSVYGAEGAVVETDPARLAALATGHELAQLYAEAVRDLNRHWPDENGECIGCGDTYPCAEEWITQRAITGIETRWRHQGRRLANLTAPETTAIQIPAAPAAVPSLEQENP